MSAKATELSNTNNQLKCCPGQYEAHRTLLSRGWRTTGADSLFRAADSALGIFTSENGKLSFFVDNLCCLLDKSLLTNGPVSQLALVTKLAAAPTLLLRS